MRVRIAGIWVAGHPDYSEQDWTGCQGAVWSPTRLGDWHAGAGHERGAFEDEGVPGFSLSFGVTRHFRSVRAVAAFLTALHSRTPPHPWRGRAEVLYDHPPFGSVALDCGDCVLQLAGPVQSIGNSGTLSVVLRYMLHGGVIGAQPTIVDPVTPPTPPDYDYTENYADLGDLDDPVIPGTPPEDDDDL